MTEQKLKVPWSRPDVGAEEAAMVEKVLQSGWISMGPMVKGFEKKFSEYLGTKHSVMVNNGTSALIAAYLAAGIKPGDQVLVPSYTFVATVNALIVLGAKPILMDADEGTFNVTPEIVEGALKQNRGAKCVVIVDVAGMPCDLDVIAEVCSRYHVTLIEDGAEAIGAEYKGRKIGSEDHLTVFSFHAAKLLATIEGGAVTTKNSVIAEKLRLIRSHGEDPKRKYWHVTVGLNLRPLEFQGALGLAQLPKVDSYVRNRNSIAKFYSDSLRDIGMTPQAVPKYVTKHPYMIYLTLARDKARRGQIAAQLDKEGVDYRIPWPPAHMQEIGYDFHAACPVAEGIFHRTVSLPMFNSMASDQAGYVIDALKSTQR